jgi:hypothetical protein
MPDERIEVTAYSGYRGEETPRVLFINGEEVRVIEVLGAWVQEGPEDRQRKRFFRLKGWDGQEHVIYLDEDRGGWFLRG